MKIERVLLITPPSGLYRRDDRCQSKVEDQTVAVIFPPIELGYLAAVVERQGIECRLRDYPAEKKTWDDFKEDLKTFQPQVLVLNTTTPTLKKDILAAELTRELFPHTVVIGRGEYFSVFPDKALQEFPSLDILLRGEPELPLEDVIKSLQQDLPLDGIQGIAFRKEGVPVVTPERPLLQDLDYLPFPSRHLMNNSLYRSPENNEPITVVHTQRGCPARCIFCSVVITSGQKVRKRTPAKIVEELRECVEKYHIRNFLFHADTFTWDKAWVIELCRLIIDSGLNIHWGCNSRVDSIDDERLDWLKKAGCWVIAFGIESGDEEILKKMRKGTTLEQARNAIQTVKRHGIKTHAFMVIGLPWETRETFHKTMKFLREIDPDFFDFNIAYPLPGTELMKIATEDNLLIQGDPSQGSYADAVLRTFELTPDELMMMRRKALWQLYLRPKYIIRTLLTAGSPKNVWQYMKAAGKRAKNLLSS